MTIGNAGHYDGWPWRYPEPVPPVRSPKVYDFPELDKQEPEPKEEK